MMWYDIYNMIYDMTWYDIHDMIWYTWYDMIWYMIWHDIIYMIWYDIWYDMIWYTWYDMIWYDIWYDMIWYTWYDMIWYMIWYDMIYDMTWYDIHDMIWYDMMWYDIWYDMIWYTWYDMISYHIISYDTIQVRFKLRSLLTFGNTSRCLLDRMFFGLKSRLEDRHKEKQQDLKIILFIRCNYVRYCISIYTHLQIFHRNKSQYRTPTDSRWN
jgi:hypothetical protein